MRKPFFLFWCASLFFVVSCQAQEPLPPAPQPQEKAEPNGLEGKVQKVGHALVQLRDLPAERLIGPYIPSSGPFVPLTLQQRSDVYFHQTFLSAEPYIMRMFTAGIDQARDFPGQWGGGMAAYGKRFGYRYGRFVTANTIAAGGDAVFGYEPRYDICRCHGFWQRTGHALKRNFVTYNRSEQELRPQFFTFTGAFASGVVSSGWLPGKRNVWQDGAYAALSQAGWGSAYNMMSEFAVDIRHKVSKKYPKSEAGGLP